MKQDNQKTWSHDRIRCGICAVSVDEVDRYFLAESVDDRHRGCQWNKRKEGSRGIQEKNLQKNKINMNH